MMLGGGLKRKEKISGRFADALGYMYYTSAILKKYEDDGRPRADLPLVEYSAKFALYQVQRALDEVLRNFPLKSIGLLIRLMVFPLGLSLRMPNDSLSHRVAALLLKPGEARDRLCKGMYVSYDENDITGSLEVALQKVIAAEPIEKRLRAHQQRQPERMGFESWIQQLLEADELNAEEAEILRQAKAATREVIMVDEFTPEQLAGSTEVVDRVA
jgi:acyl-CoA dehydrogenase